MIKGGFENYFMPEIGEEREKLLPPVEVENVEDRETKLLTSMVRKDLLPCLVLGLTG